MKTRVIGCPKTIDGDLKCKEVPTSFGFDTACKVIFRFDHFFFFYQLLHKLLHNQSFALVSIPRQESNFLFHQKNYVGKSLLKTF